MVVPGPGAVPPACPGGGQARGTRRARGLGCVPGGDWGSPARGHRSPRRRASKRDQSIPQVQGELSAVAPGAPAPVWTPQEKHRTTVKGASALSPARDTPSKPQCGGGFASDGGPHPRLHANISL